MNEWEYQLFLVELECNANREMTFVERLVDSFEPVVEAFAAFGVSVQEAAAAFASSSQVIEDAFRQA